MQTAMSRKWILEDLLSLWDWMGFKNAGVFFDKQNSYAYAGFQKK